jgi:hypothetical protein|tara:strand:- start:286 stop:537 length:252 start_codon:yes stop_codon:yes gene_type:complete
MTEISSNRGTSKKNVDNKKSNWAGKEFKEYQDQRKEDTKDEEISSSRGTSTSKVEETIGHECNCDHSGMKKSTKRGTSSETIE